jgi:hypothetical protein
MRRALLSLFVALVALIPPGLFAASPPFAIAVVQTKTNSANDVTITMDAAPSGSNHVVFAAVMNAGSAQTFTITGTPTAVTTLQDSSNDTVNLHGFVGCFQGDGADASFTINSSGSATVRAAAVEISGGSCTETGTSRGTAQTVATSTHALGSITTTAGAFVMSFIHANSVADFTKGALPAAAVSVPSDGSEIDTVAQGMYYINTAGGAVNLSYDSAANETTYSVGAAVEAGAAGTAKPPASLLLRGVGGQPTVEKR